MKSRFYVATFVALLTGGCVQYAPAPLDLQADAVAWQQMSREMSRGRKSLGQEELHKIGLLMNEELLKARLTHAKSQGKEKYAGLWEDPSMGMELERVFSDNINNRGISPSLALPVTGLPALRKKIAAQYTEADYWTLRAQERAFLTSLDTLCYKLMVSNAKLGLMQRRLVVLRDEQQRITRLYELGEVAFADYQTGTERLNATVKELQEQERDLLTQQQELVAELGLHPSTTGLMPAGRLPQGVPAAVSTPSPEEMLSAPAIRAQLAGYGAAEDELRAEIRKQYPEVRLSGLIAVDDHKNKGALGVEFTLPLWNRNREAIAISTGERKLKQAETLRTWHDMMQQATAMQAQQKLLLTHCRSEYTRLIELEAATAQQEKLFGLGETSLLELAEARHLAYERKLAYLDCLANLLETQTKLQYLNPFYHQQ